MEEIQENWATHQNGPNPPLKYHLQLKTKRGCWGVVVWDFRREEGNAHGDGKQMFGK